MSKLSPDDVKTFVSEWSEDESSSALHLVYAKPTKDSSDAPRAEYQAEVNLVNGDVIYTVKGHGIGSSDKQCKSIEVLTQYIVNDNSRFNSGQEFYINYTAQ